MFLSRVKHLRLLSLSLVTKLMLLYSLSTIGMMTVVSVYLYPTFSHIMQKVNATSESYITVQCYEKIIVSFLLCALSAIFLGYIIARKGLNRMKAFENKMEEISGDSLHERIALKEWPKELTTLAIKFNSMLDRLQTSFNQLTQFSSDIAHELRTPLNNLRVITELALSKNTCPSEYKKMFEIKMEQYQHLSKLIENLLFLARSNHGEVNLKLEKVDARDQILNLIDYYQAVASEKNITLTCQGHANIFVDTTLFKRVISNLLSNALEHTSQNGNVTITLESAHPWVNIYIEDNGSGIAETHLNKLFDRFYRVDQARSSGSGSLGLGLAIVKSIVDLHKGKINVKSTVNLGTTVTLQLPT